MPLEREALRGALESKGFQNLGGDHDFYHLYVGGKKTAVFTKLSRGKDYREYGDPLVAAVSKQMGLTKTELQEFVECTIGGVEYVKRLKQRGRL